MALYPYVRPRSQKAPYLHKSMSFAYVCALPTRRLDPLVRALTATPKNVGESVPLMASKASSSQPLATRKR